VHTSTTSSSLTRTPRWTEAKHNANIVVRHSASPAPSAAALAAVLASTNANKKDRLALRSEPIAVRPDTMSRPKFVVGERNPQDLEHGELLVEALRKLTGLWVAIRDEQVMASATSPLEIVRMLRDRGLRADSVFRVPRDARGDLGEG
jgi:hypothetical protein